MTAEEELANAITEAQAIKSTAALRKVDPLLLFEVLTHRRQAEAITAITEGLDYL